MSQIERAFVVDGQIFATQEAAQAYIRKPKILEALNKLTENNTALSEWLLAQQETIEMAFEVGTLRRVSKAEHKKLADNLAYLVENHGNDKKLAFLVEHANVIKDVFRWPTVKRLTEAEKATAARNTLMAANENNEELTTWIVANKEAILAAYDAGIEKREVPQSANAGLAEYRAEMARRKTIKEEQGEEALAKHVAEYEARKKAEKEAKAAAAAK